MEKTQEIKVTAIMMNSGSFCVHVAGCADAKREIKKTQNNHFDFKASSRMEIVEGIYSDHIEEHLEDEGDYYSQFIHDVHIAPCVHLPEGVRKY